ncbi:MAG: hypothetical protein K5696_13200 [Lachnospiraceae bacterium]|nr:hypothetical protein [Lachnospiraceae bacterium]
MKNSLHSSMTRVLATALSALLAFSPANALIAQAEPEVTNDDRWEDGYASYFDISDHVVRIKAGESAKLTMFARFPYSYYTTGETSKNTWCECSMNAGTEEITIHIGADEAKTNVFFYFYLDNSRLNHDITQDAERYATVEVYVQPASGQAAVPAKTTVSKSVAAPLAGGKNGTISLTRDDTVAMLYDAAGTALASFSISDGSGKMPKLTLGGIVQQNKKNYFTVNTASKNANVVKISDSDRAVMTAKGYAGVCLNGSYVNWP